MFEPGHLHSVNAIGSAELPVFSLDLFYEVRQDSTEGAMLHMHMVCEVAGTAFEDASSYSYSACQHRLTSGAEAWFATRARPPRLRPDV